MSDLALIEVCEHCGGMGWVSYDVPIEHRRFGKLFPCDHCHEGQEIVALRIKNRVKQSGLKKRYVTMTFERWDRELTNAEKQGKKIARLAAGDFATAQDYEVDLATIHRRLAIPWTGETAVKNSLVLWGIPGTGKTGLASSVFNKLVKQGVQPLYIRAKDVMKQVRKDELAEIGERKEVLESIQDASVLLIDEANQQKYSAFELQVMEDIIRHRHGELLPTLVTCNISQHQFYDQWDYRTADALAEMAHWIEVGEPRIRSTS